MGGGAGVAAVNSEQKNNDDPEPAIQGMVALPVSDQANVEDWREIRRRQYQMSVQLPWFITRSNLAGKCLHLYRNDHVTTGKIFGKVCAQEDMVWNRQESLVELQVTVLESDESSRA